MKPKPSAERIYGPMQAKTFAEVLGHWLAEEFPHLGGPKVRALFVDEVLRLIDAYYVPSQRLQPGQTVWYAVDKLDVPRDRRTMAQLRLLPVVLTIVAPEDIDALVHGTPVRVVRRQVVARLHREADAQGGVLAETDTALLLNQGVWTISHAIRQYEHEQQCVIPRRGTVHDMGRSVSHKGLIAKKALVEGKSPPTVAWEAAHSLSSVERYLVDLMRVYISLRRRGMSVDETAFATGLSRSLVQEYDALIGELGVSDDRLPEIMAALEQAARGRQTAIPRGAASQAASPDLPSST